MEDTKLRIGKITKEVEHSLRVSLTSDVSLYVTNEVLDKMASSRPATYLKLLDKVKDLIKTADFARMERDQKYIEYAKMHYRGGSFCAMVVRFKHEGCPSLWELESLSMWRSGEEITEGERTPFRPVVRKARKTKSEAGDHS